MPKGKFISFEGIDGCGKSTQLKRCAQALREAGHDVIATREPGGSPGAEDIRGLLLSGSTDKWTAETEILLFTAARRDHLERTIQPRLDAGQIVMTDRFADSTRVYQGATRGDLRSVVDELHSLMIGREPDITLVFDMDPKVALARGLARGTGEDRFEDFGLGFQETLRAGFKALAQEYPDRVILVDAGHDINTAHQLALTAILDRL